MKKKDLQLDEYMPIDGTITRLSELSREQFIELMSCNHPEAIKYRRHARLEFKNRQKCYEALNNFYRDCYLKE